MACSIRVYRNTVNNSGIKVSKVTEYMYMSSISSLMRLVLCVGLAWSVLPAQAAETCTPKGDRGKILRSKDANDIDSYVGSAWSLINVRRDGSFLSGTLVTPRQSTEQRRVFVIADEWTCG